ncbi:hypothetical protein KR018_005591 [Drosophila ironensis]|nr:hypothetical protein KR018_005591 [Drosophila ironensis]
MACKLVNILILVLLPMIAESQTPNSYCVDCREESKEKCIITSKPGYLCTSRGFRHDHSHLYVAEESHNLDICIPKDMNITENYGYCCVWSRKMGCQILIADGVPPEPCYTCRIGGLGPSPKCPCKKSGNLKSTPDSLFYGLRKFIIFWLNI